MSSYPVSDAAETEVKPDVNNRAIEDIINKKANILKSNFEWTQNRNNKRNHPLIVTLVKVLAYKQCDRAHHTRPPCTTSTGVLVICSKTNPGRLHAATTTATRVLPKAR